MSGSDAAFFYQFGVGLVLFAAGLAIGYRHRDWSFRKGERREAALLAAIFFGYLAVQGFFQFVAPRI